MYCYDVLHLHHDPDTFMNHLAEVYRLKDGSVVESDRYLGANIKKVKLDDGSVAWLMTSIEYVKNVIQNLEYTIDRDSAQPLKIFVNKAGERSFPSNYRPKLDVSPVCDNTSMSQYLQLIEVPRWAIELGKIDIMAEVSV